MYAFAPENPPGLVGRNFCLAILCFFAKASMMVLSLSCSAPGAKDVGE
jgi:hypothetical protein